MKLIKLFTINLIILLLLFSSCKKSEEINEPYYKPFEIIQKDNLKIVVASDLHFLSKTMCEEGSSILKENYYGDGRVICYNEEIIDAFVYQMIIEKPDVVLLTGDLTFDGSYQNHIELTKKLNKLVDNNIRVLSIPGNHDLNNSLSKRYLKDRVQTSQHLTAKDYEEIYYNFGRGNAVSKDKDSYSYYYKLSNTFGIIMVDDNIYDINGDKYKTSISGLVKDTTITWLTDILDKANKENMDIIVASHHNIFTHSTMFVDSYQIKNHDTLLQLLTKYNVRLYLSGHMHIQHQENKNNLTEVLTSALSITPHQYGVIEYSNKSNLLYNYYTKKVDVSSYAKAHNITDPKLLDFDNYSRNFYAESSYIKSYEQMMFKDSSMHKEALASANLMKLLNPVYFEGSAYMYTSEIKDLDDYKLLKRYKLSSYIDSIIEGSLYDYRLLKIYR